MLVDRAFYYSFLAKIFEKPIDLELLEELKSSELLLEFLGGNELKEWFYSNSDEKLLDELNIDFTSALMINNPPFESSVLHNKTEILTGMQNPAMFYYYKSGYKFLASEAVNKIPDHISTEFLFMYELIKNSDKQRELEFFSEHILTWVPPFMIALEDCFMTPFYKSIASFCAEFILKECELQGEE
ncbi:MAG: molecular chaperone [Campylobacterales bacterium]